MRISGARWTAGLFVLSVGYGCYSSIAETAKIDPGNSSGGTSSSNGIIEPPAGDACAERKPWEGPGITGFIPMTGNEAMILSGDRYFVAEIVLQGDASTPSLGRVDNWKESGHLAQLWANSPPEPTNSSRIWDDPGVTATYSTSQGDFVISRFRRWVKQGETWPAAGAVTDDWRINDAGPPLIDAQAPWTTQPGVTATYFTPGGDSFVVISSSLVWTRDTRSSQPANWTWLADASVTGEMKDIAMWSGAPAVGNQRPYEGKGVTAAWYLPGGKLFVFSVDRMWTHDGNRWTSSGLVKDQPGWDKAPTAKCQ